MTKIFASPRKVFAFEDLDIMAVPSEALVSSISKLLHDADTADFSLICEFKEWRLHSFILATRSPFFKAAISNNTLEKHEKKIEIRDLDSEAMQQVINYMYGASVERRHYKDLINILEASVRFQMDDLKEYVVSMLKQSITRENVAEIGHISEMYNIDQLLKNCVDFIVKNDIEVDLEEGVSKFAATILTTVQKAYKKSKKDLKDCQEKIRINEHVNFKVVGENGRAVNFRNVRKLIKMASVKKTYSKKAGVCILNRAFYFKGRRIMNNETPEDLNIKNDDVIKVRTRSD